MKKYKFLIIFLVFIFVILITNCVNAVDISTKEELIKFAQDVNSGNTFEGETIYLRNDINLEGNQENQWVPIGSTNTPFKGTFEGNGYIISGIYINNNKVEDKGLFGYNEGIIRNTGIKNAILDISKCNNSINLGTIAGRNLGTIRCCYNSSNIITEINCRHAYTYIGGIVGCNEGTIEFCYNIGNMQVNIINAAQICTGTIVGHTNENSNVRNCYNIGNIGVEKIKVAYLGYGMIGHHLHGDISKCYYLSGTSERGRGYNKQDEEGIIESKESSELKEETFLSEINEVDNLYFVKDYKNINNGYPILYWQKDDESIINRSELKEIQIKIPPIKTEYTEGEKFDKTGMVVIAIYSDGTTKEITSYTILPQEGLKKENEYIKISYTEDAVIKSTQQKINVNEKKEVVLKEIKIKTPPVKTEYMEGEKFDKTGMVIIAIYSDEATKEIISYTISPQVELKKENDCITISYTEDGETKSVIQKIRVNEVKQNQIDNTISSNALPNTGKLIGIILIIVLVGILIIFNYINIKKYKDI